MVRGQLGRRLEEQRTSLVGCLPALIVGVEEPVAEELELELLDPVLLENRPQLAERLGLQQVLEVGMPEPDALEAHALGLFAAFAQAEEAPLWPEVHLDRPGDGQ